MHIVEWIQTRPSKDVKWFSHEKLDELNNARSDFSGFLGKGVFLSEDKLSRTVVTKWDSQDSSEQFFLAFEELIEECNILTLVYNQENGITLDRSSRAE
jgi:hypothetical protein